MFGYDISCLASFCAGINNEDDGLFCNLIESRGLDGLAFGSYFKNVPALMGAYLLCFRNNTEDGLGNTCVFPIYGGPVVSFLFNNFVEPSSDYAFDGSAETTSGIETGFGLGNHIWSSSHLWTIDAPDFAYMQAFRFIG